MRGVTGRAVPAKFRTGMCEMKSYGGKNDGFFVIFISQVSSSVDVFSCICLNMKRWKVMKS